MADVPADESSAQRQARLRREKRNAKIQAEGNDRLAKITGLSGRPAPAVENVSPAPAPPSAADDPDEVDISEHHWTPQSRNQQISALQAQQNRQDPFAEMNSQPMSGQDDPMMQMMQQMLGGAGGMSGMFGGQGMGGPSDSQPGEMPGLPPFMQAMMNGQQGGSQAAAQPKSDSTYVWRILHTFFAFALAMYIAVTTTFNGTKLSRAAPIGDDQSVGMNVFYLFATVELVLQSSRYFLEKGQLQGSGWTAMIANSGMVPEPWAGYVRTLGRYLIIWQMVVADAMVIVFVLGVLAWWKGKAVA